MKQLAFFSFVAALLISLSLHAQTFTGGDADKMIPGAETIILSEYSSVPTYILFREGKEINMAHVIPWIKNSLGMNEQSDLQLITVENDALGISHYRYRQTYNQIPVEGTMYILHSKGDRVISMNGFLSDQIHVATQPVLSESSSLEKALAYMNAASYRWQSVAHEKELKRITGDEEATWLPKGLLTIVPAGKEGVPRNYRLTYRFDIYSDKPVKREYVFTDALTGEIIYAINRIETANARGTAVTAYSGTQVITTDSTGATSFRLRETGRGKGIETYNLKATTNYAGAVDFTDADNFWNNANASKDQYATDAHWGAEKAYDFYIQKFGRNSIDNSGLKLISYVHYSTGLINAAWDGNQVYYGDGGSGYTPLTSLEIVGHEISHGLTQYTSGLSSMNNEAGALNEGFSDCMGVSIRHFGEQSAIIDWGIGNHLGGTPFRSMSNPKQYGSPDTYKGINWDFANQEVHQNGTVLGHWFYLLTQGGSGTNDNGNAYSVTGIGIEKAQAICYRMNVVYLTQNAFYADARTYSIRAAKDLYGDCSNEVIQTTNAWRAVGVGAAFSESVSGSFAAAATGSCSAPANIYFNNTSSNANSYLWTFGDGDSSISVNPTHTYSSYGTYTVTLLVNGGTCGTVNVIKTNYIHISNQRPAINPVSTFCKGASASLTATGTDTIRWYSVASGGSPLSSGAVFNTPSINAATTYYAESNIYSASFGLGPLNNTIGNGGYYTAAAERALVFSCFSPVKLISVAVYALAGGNRTINLRDSAGNILDSRTLNVPSGKSTVTLNFNIPVGNNMQLGCGSSPNLYRNTTGVSYPYNIWGIISISENNSGGQAPGYYYFFYDWLLQSPPCITERTPVTLTPDGAAFTYQTSSLTASFIDGSINATSWFWNFGDGVNDTSTQQNPVHTYSTSGAYNVILIAESNGCTDTVYQIVNVIETGTATYSKNMFTLYPNPSTGEFTVYGLQFTTAPVLNIYNMLGERIMVQPLKRGDHSFVNVQKLPAGIYFVNIEDEKGRWIGKLVKE